MSFFILLRFFRFGFYIENKICGLLCSAGREEDEPLVVLQFAQPSLYVRCALLELACDTGMRLQGAGADLRDQFFLRIRVAAKLSHLRDGLSVQPADMACAVYQFMEKRGIIRIVAFETPFLRHVHKVLFVIVEGTLFLV